MIQTFFIAQFLRISDLNKIIEYIINNINQSMQKNFMLSLFGIGLTFLLSNQKKLQCCGIIGIISKRKQNIGPDLCEGIQLLKNRGYDSAGIMAMQSKPNSTPILIRHADELNNKLNCIQRVIQQVTQNIIKSNIGIGHTRWATCGEKISKNAHPHYDNSKSIYIVHNGIIGNHSKIKTNHLEKTDFHSDTDSQVIVQLLGKFKAEGLSITQGLKKVQQIVSSTSQWGLVVIDTNQPDAIYTSTKGSPILIGLGDDQIYIASEVIAFLKHTRQYFETKDGQIYELKIQSLKQLREQMKKENRLKIFDNQDQVFKYPPVGFKTFYEYEIRRQGKIPFNPDFSRIKSISFGPYLTMIGCGSSYFAADASHHFFKKLKAFKKITLIDPVQLDKDEIVQGQTAVLISQSGQTKDLINIVQKCKTRQNVNTIGIINVQGSTLARKVDFPIYIKVGRQVAVAATKSFYHQTLNLIQFATQVAQQKKSVQYSLIKQIRQELKIIPEKTQITIQHVEQLCSQLAQILYKKQSLYLLAKREGLAIAKQAALKIKELNYIHAQALGACEMKHGSIAMIQSDKKQQTAVILFVFDNETYEQLMNAVDQMLSRNAYVIIITDCKQKIDESNKEKKKQNKNISSNYHFMIDIPKMKHLSHLLSLIPMQILVQKIAQLKKINPDMPRNLAKTVTV